MQTNIIRSIQEYCKKINREISFSVLTSLFLTFVVILGLFFYILFDKENNKKKISFYKNNNDTDVSYLDSRPFGSINGKTYTYSWCSLSSKILNKNKIFFKNEDDAVKSGRTLSKMCK